jgi:hypothetical protein
MCSEWYSLETVVGAGSGTVRVDFFDLSPCHCSGDLCLLIISGRHLRRLDLCSGVLRDVSAVGGEANRVHWCWYSVWYVLLGTTAQVLGMRDIWTTGSFFAVRK